MCSMQPTSSQAVSRACFLPICGLHLLARCCSYVGRRGEGVAGAAGRARSRCRPDGLLHATRAMRRIRSRGTTASRGSPSGELDHRSSRTCWCELLMTRAAQVLVGDHGARRGRPVEQTARAPQQGERPDRVRRLGARCARRRSVSAGRVTAAVELAGGLPRPRSTPRPAAQRGAAEQHGLQADRLNHTSVRDFGRHGGDLDRVFKDIREDFCGEHGLGPDRPANPLRAGGPVRRRAPAAVALAHDVSCRTAAGCRAGWLPGSGGEAANRHANRPPGRGTGRQRRRQNAGTPRPRERTRRSERGAPKIVALARSQTDSGDDGTG